MSGADALGRAAPLATTTAYDQVRGNLVSPEPTHSGGRPTPATPRRAENPQGATKHARRSQTQNVPSLH
jgi:hypothetical protein